TPRPARVSTSRVPTRRPTTFGQTREALACVLGDVQWVMVPAHHNHQGIAMWRGTSTPRSVLTRQPDHRRIWALGGTAQPHIFSGFREFRLGDVFRSLHGYESTLVGRIAGEGADSPSAVDYLFASAGLKTINREY